MIRDKIENFVPFNEQEKRDKEVILKWIDTFDDVLTRDNVFGHFTSAAIVLNKEKTKVLMIYHNIYNSWSWVGGHVDGDVDFLHVALKEAEEETGVKNFKVLCNDIFLLDTLPVLGHFKREEYVPSHVHLNVAFLLEADESEELHIKPDENSGVKWIPIEKIIESSTEDHMKILYAKVLEKLKLVNV